METVRELVQTTSTNDEIKQAIDQGVAEGLSVRALRQTAGYGRQGRSWESPLGGLYQSFLMRPQAPSGQLPTLSLVMGMAVCNTVRDVLPDARRGQVMVKWPNDVVLMGDGSDEPAVFKKIAGISLERYKDAVCVGIGINVAAPEPSQGGTRGEDGGIPAHDMKNKAVYLDDLGFWEGSVESRIAQVSKVLTQKVWAQYGQWQRIGFGAFSQSFNAYYNALSGQHVSMVDINGSPLASGQVQWVNEVGELVLLDARGCEQRVASGEAHIV